MSFSGVSERHIWTWVAPTATSRTGIGVSHRLLWNIGTGW